jgi:hypothetical protein
MTAILSLEATDSVSPTPDMLQDRFDDLGLFYDADYKEGKAIVE